MPIAPQTNIRLLKVPFELDNKNQLTFSSVTAQTNYFLSLPYLLIDNCSYQRHDNYINFPEHIDNILHYNYVMYQNENYSNKYFYSFITNMEYVNDNLTRVYIETDCFQSWQFDIIYHNMFIEREHVNDDTIGINTIPENLDVGTPIQESLDEYLTYGNNDYYFAINGTYNPLTNKDFIGVNKINGNFFGSWIFLFPVTSGSVGLPEIKNFIEDVNNNGKIESISSMYILPKTLVDGNGKESFSKTGIGAYKFYLMNTSNSALDILLNFDKTYTFSDYNPKNNKCFTYPYNYLLVSNNIGNYNIFKYELFSQANPAFTCEMAISMGASIRLVPRDYKNMNYNYDESIPLAKFPTCDWSSDSFTNWLTQNAVNIGSQVISAGVNIATGNVAGLAGQIGNVIGGFYEASLQPSLEGGNNNGDVNFASKSNTFQLHHMRCKTEYMQIIDNYFSMFGYKTNRLKIPNIVGRPNWNYVKTIDCNITGDFPQQDIQTLKNMMDNGVTFWHNPSTFLDYSQNNK